MSIAKESDFVKHLIDYERSEEDKDEEALRIIEETDEKKVVSILEKEIEQDIKDEEPDDIELIVTSMLGKKFYSTFKTEIDSAMSVLETMTEPFFSADTYSFVMHQYILSFLH